MFENLSNRLAQTFQRIAGTGRLTESNIQDTLREVRVALLEADVALSVVKEFIERIREKAIGETVLKSLTPGQALINIVNDELTTIMGERCDELNLSVQPPAVILMAGLQGSGKTTTVAKLARWLKEKQKKSVLLASTDIYRPAAIKQLETLAHQNEVEFFSSSDTQHPVTIAKDAIQEAKRKVVDVVIIDTAGRLHIDEEMMTEIKDIHKAINPVETLFVVDSMTGQDAANTAKAFNDALPLTGVILTKIDGDARGGAALSVRSITGKPIKFIGVGEKTDALEPFHPDRIAGRILGKGDILTLVEEAKHKLDEDKAKKMAKKLQKGKGFDLEDFRDQLKQLGKMGGIMGVMSKLPGLGAIPKAAKDQMNDKMVIQIEAIINSMTPKERRFPDVIKGSRKRRIAAGSGTEIQDVNRILKQFNQMQKMLKKFKKGGLMKLMRNMQGQLPPGGSDLPF